MRRTEGQAQNITESTVFVEVKFLFLLQRYRDHDDADSNTTDGKLVTVLEARKCLQYFNLLFYFVDPWMCSHIWLIGPTYVLKCLQRPVA